jgi:hypothetical protein
LLLVRGVERVLHALVQDPSPERVAHDVDACSEPISEVILYILD